MQLRDKVALVTGANRGIGACIAETLAGAGASVGVHYHAAADMAAEVVANITAKGGRAVAIKADIRDRDEAMAMVAAAVKAFGPLDILVNNLWLGEGRFMADDQTPCC